MSILERISRLVRANINNAIDKAEDPALIIDQSLRDMKDAFQEARSQVAEAMAQQNKLTREMKINEEEAKKYTDKAEMALRENREDLAKEALVRAENFKELARGFAEQIEIQGKVIDSLKSQLSQLEEKINSMESRKKLLLARKEVAEAGQVLRSSLDNKRSKGAMSAFEAMEDKISGMEDKISALDELNNTKNSIDEQLEKLGSNRAVDDAFAALKAKIDSEK